MVIRIARPGEPVRFLDMGPAHGRILGQNYGGSIAVSRPPSPRLGLTPPSQLARATRNNLRRKAEAMGLCGRSIKTVGVCARAKGHGYECRTREWMDRKAASYRANYVPNSRGAYKRRAVVEP